MARNMNANYVLYLPGPAWLLLLVKQQSGVEMVILTYTLATQFAGSLVQARPVSDASYVQIEPENKTIIAWLGVGSYMSP